MGKNAQHRRSEKFRKGKSKARPPTGATTNQSAPPETVPIELFGKTLDESLDPRTVHKLNMVWMLLNAVQLDRANKTTVPLLQLNVPYRHLTHKTLDTLVLAGVPATSPTPLKFNYSNILSPCLSGSVSKNRFYNSLVDLLYCYWSIQKGLALLQINGLLKAAVAVRNDHKSLIEFIAKETGRTQEELNLEDGPSLNPQMLEAKWYADAVIVKIRAFWDKLLNWIGHDYFQIKLDSKSLGDESSGRIGQLVKGKLNALDPGATRELLDGLVKELCELGELKQYRDSDLHFISPRIIEGFGRADKDMDMSTLLEWMSFEFIRCTEGLITSFAVILSTKHAAFQ